QLNRLLDADGSHLLIFDRALDDGGAGLGRINQRLVTLLLGLLQLLLGHYLLGWHPLLFAKRAGMDHVLMVRGELLHLSVQVIILVLPVVVCNGDAFRVSLDVIEGVDQGDVVVLLGLEVVVVVAVATCVEALHDVVLGLLVIKALRLLLGERLVAGLVGLLGNLDVGRHLQGLVVLEVLAGLDGGVLRFVILLAQVIHVLGTHAYLLSAVRLVLELLVLHLAEGLVGVDGGLAGDGLGEGGALRYYAVCFLDRCHGLLLLHLSLGS
ncbi:MAG: hypothetical protein ACMG6E_07115, partial [Candidatus Roizmanbacteria bacterium]